MSLEWQPFQVDGGMSVGDVFNFENKFIEFHCTVNYAWLTVSFKVPSNIQNFEIHNCEIFAENKLKFQFYVFILTSNYLCQKILIYQMKIY